MYVRGLFLEGAGWNAKEKCLCEPTPLTELVVEMPVIHFKPTHLKKSSKTHVLSVSSVRLRQANGYTRATELRVLRRVTRRRRGARTLDKTRNRALVVSRELSRRARVCNDIKHSVLCHSYQWS